MLKLVNELLNFRKLETGNIQLNVSKNNLVDFVNEIYLSYLQKALNTGVPHISSYALTVEPKTALEKFIENGVVGGICGKLNCLRLPSKY